ncbi:Bile acid 7-alpha dehydratase [Nocardioides dokdonensis FR1436]|uniref:Bile acid 7-alpha dehydratase n=1 Tax=Nocardioides dokdonensis FR1436 TaxID=1300347 RepID=A0A1A9GG49_9ACTN|nr:nuclear transport factor 2 family protein [Nocardioides dokdonensis]ANH37309.1 Bile acid 7-alpha dehydratase [Nocardioides dokdonensis FR1436]
MTPTLEQRIARLEAIEAIKVLKHRYLRACDHKDPEGFRAAFVARGAVVDYGPKIGRFEDADGVTEVYRRMALQRREGAYVVLDMHHGLHPDIEVLSGTEARGRWTLRFRQVTLADRMERVSTIEYDDRYVVEDGAWRISSCHVRTLWTLATPLAEGADITETLS